MKALFDSVVRTLTPIIVGAVIGWAVTQGITLDPQFELALIAVITGAAQGLYYIAVRLFETYVSPKFGWLLGLAKKPVYTPVPMVDVNIRGVAAQMTREQYRDYLDARVKDAAAANAE